MFLDHIKGDRILSVRTMNFEAIFRSDTQPPNRCFLLISHEGSEYLGCLLFDDHAFCRQVMELLKVHCNRTIGNRKLRCHVHTLTSASTTSLIQLFLGLF